MKALVTGGAGFIGSHLCDALLRDGHEVMAIDDLSLGREDNIVHLSGNKSFAFVKMDILDAARMDSLFASKSFDAVFHLAANSDIAVSHKNPSVDLDRTFLTTFRTLEAMRAHGVKNLVFASTSAIYGEAKGKLTENHGPLQPVSHYGACKLASESIISSYVANYGLKAWITRFPNVVGERATHGVILDFVRKLRRNPSELEVLGDGRQFKPYIYVKDLVEAILFVWSKANANLNVYGVGVESRMHVSEIAEMVIEEMKLAAKIRYTGGSRGWVGDVPEFDYDLAKIHALGWSASISSNEAVRKSIQYILRSGIQ